MGNKFDIMSIKSFLICLQFIAITANAQVNTDDLQFIIKASRIDIHLQYPDYVKTFYKSNEFQYVWLNNQNNTQTLLQLLQTAPDLGLNKEDYPFDFIQSFRHNHYIPPARQDSLISELRLTDAALHFFRDITYGNHKLTLGYNGLSYYPDCLENAALMATAIKENRLSGFVNDLEPDVAGYRILKSWMLIYNQSNKDSLFKESKITSNRVNNSNQPLVNRLYYLGIIDSLNVNYSDAYIRSKVRSAQHLFNLMDDGILQKLTIEELKNFYNPYSVYLHDTPWKVLFNFNRRYFSHGCIRVEKALELAQFLLKENAIAVDTLVEKGCLRNQAPLPVQIIEHTPVFVLYNTAWIDSAGIVQYHEDIYRKNNFIQKSF